MSITKDRNATRTATKKKFESTTRPWLASCTAVLVSTRSLIDISSSFWHSEKKKCPSIKTGLRGQLSWPLSLRVGPSRASSETQIQSSLFCCIPVGAINVIKGLSQISLNQFYGCTARPAWLVRNTCFCQPPRKVKIFSGGW